MTKVSFIIPSYNLWPFLSKCLLSIYTSHDTYEKEIIVVDNASTDSTQEKISHLAKAFEQKGQELKYVRLDRNEGYLKANNIGLNHATGDVIFYCNNDIQFYPDTITLLVCALASHNDYGIAGGFQMTWNGSPNMKKAFLDTNDIGTLKLEEIKEDDLEYIENDFVSSACSAIKREVINKVGSYDERFVPHWWEDIDFQIRVRMAGYKIVIVKNAKFRHYGGASNPQPRYEAQSILQDKWKELKNMKREEIFKN